MVSLIYRSFHENREKFTSCHQYFGPDKQIDTFSRLSRRGNAAAREARAIVVERWHCLSAAVAAPQT
jgi:hypothetical protein